MWTTYNGEVQLDQNDHEELTKLLIGRKIEKVDENTLLLDDGTVLDVRGNEGGCACSAGDYELTTLNGVDNVITSVEIEDGYVGERDSDYDYGDQWYRIFVYAQNEQLLLAEFEGSDGNGYYGTGFNITVRKSVG
jgi:hypothetical protein